MEAHGGAFLAFWTSMSKYVQEFDVRHTRYEKKGKRKKKKKKGGSW